MKTRIKWNEDEIESLAAAFVRLRSKDPFITVRPLLTKSQEECLTDDKHRALASVNVVPLLKERIKALYAKALLAEPLPPQIIEIPVEKPVDYIELANRLDTPTLAAILTDRIIKGLSGLRVNNGSEVHSATAKAAPASISMLAVASLEKKRLVRVAFCHVELKVFSQLQEQVERSKIEIELRGVDIAHRGGAIPVSCDYVVFMKNAIGGVYWKTAMAGWPHKRIFTVDNNVEAAMQKMRDIASLQVHVPAQAPNLSQVRA
jgi:hypothetical protein